MALRVAIAHDWLVRAGGAELVLEQFVAEWPGAPLLASLVDPSRLPADLARAQPSPLQMIPGARRRHDVLLPLMPLAWALRPILDGYDAVVASSYCCAHAVRVAGDTPLVCYCHTPVRYAWDYAAEKGRVPRPLRGAGAAGMAVMRRWDRRVSRRVDHYVANSRAVAGRIRRFYGREARVVHPPVRTGYFTPSGEVGDHFLFVGRLTGYKRPDLVVDAFAELPYPLVVVGSGSMEAALRERATPNVRFAGAVGDDEVRALMRSSRALVFPADEDFGIVMAEAQACGTPVIGLAGSGASDIVDDGETGFLVERQTPGEVRRAVHLAASQDLDRAEISRRAQRFGGTRFRDEMRVVVDAAVAAARASGTRRGSRA